MKYLFAALGILTLSASMASAQGYYGERREYREREREREYRYSGGQCAAIRRSIYDLERMLRSGNAGGGTRPALYEARAKYARRCS